MNRDSYNILRGIIIKTHLLDKYVDPTVIINSRTIIGKIKRGGKRDEYKVNLNKELSCHSIFIAIGTNEEKKYHRTSESVMS
jgi:hypothetical protein